jgi:thioester reductase-like protein
MQIHPPIILSLAQRLDDISRGNTPKPDTELKDMVDLVEQYSNISQTLFSKATRAAPTSKVPTVLLTGATGALGAHILTQLLYHTPPSNVICLVRATSHSDALSRVSESLALRRQPFSLLHQPQFKCLASDPSSPALGLTDSEHSKLKASVNIIIHAAWPVNFSLPLRTFSSQFQGLQNLFALGNDPDIFFCSSTASVLGETHPDIIKEQIPTNPKAADKLGYSRSKWVAENICAGVAKQRSGRTAVLRIGQLTGDEKNGVWNMSEAWPRMLSTVEVLGCLPALGDGEKLSWLPMDVAARAVIEIALQKSNSDKEKDVEVYHLTNNDTSRTWIDLLKWLGEIRGAFEVVKPSLWLERLEGLQNHPAKGLLDLWKNAYGSRENGTGEGKKVAFDMKKTKIASPAMKDVKALDKAHFEKIWKWLEASLGET